MLGNGTTTTAEFLCVMRKIVLALVSSSVVSLSSPTTTTMPALGEEHAIYRADGSVKTQVTYEYQRCKETYRCSWAYTEYDVASAQYTFTKQTFAGGKRQPAALFLDFENWHSGTHGWVDGGTTAARTTPFDSFASNTTGALYIREGAIVFDTGTLTWFNASDASNTSLPFWGLDAQPAPHGPSNVRPTGHVMETTHGEPVAVFNFESIFVGEGVRVAVRGHRPFALLSRSSAIFNATVDVAPLSLGGYSGGSDLAPFNAHGPGSPSVRVHLYTVTTAATDVDEVQTVRTYAAVGQNVGGTFPLAFDGAVTAPIHVDASHVEVVSQIEQGLPTAGKVDVVRGAVDAQGGRTWTLTFKTQIGEMAQLVASGVALTGTGAGVDVATLANGNSIGGNFTLAIDGVATRPLAHNASATEVRAALVADVRTLRDVDVVRSSALPSPRCANGLCVDTPTPGGGYTWTIRTVASNVFDGDRVGLDARPSEVAGTMVAVGSLSGAGATIVAVSGHTLHGSHSFAELNASIPPVFSLSFCGGGGGFGGAGGAGQGCNWTGAAYGDETLTRRLAGGSGGALGGPDPHAVLGYAQKTALGVGGAGGGVVVIAAVNDVWLGKRSSITVSGEAGTYGHWGGGGGSGGAIVISAGGTVVHEGSLVARGAAGGGGVAGGGGGGGGGRIALFAQALTLRPPGGGVGTYDVSGGAAGAAVAIAPGTDPSQAFGGANATRTFHVEDGSVSAAQRGANGTTHVRTNLAVNYRLDALGGFASAAANTSSALRLSGVRSRATGSSDVQRLSPRVAHGPEYSLLLGEGNRSAALATRSSPWVTPDRATFYVQIGDFMHGEIQENAGAYFGLRAQNGSGSAGAGGLLNVSGDATEAAMNAEVLIGVAVVQGTFRHGANFMHTPRSNEWSDTFDDDVAVGRWYKVDIYISWRTQTYSVRLDNVLKVYAAPFVGRGVSAVMLHNFDAMTVWFDQIYLGDDDTMGFFCPRSKGSASGGGARATLPTNGSNIEMDRPTQTGWGPEDLGPSTSYTPMKRHASHLSRRGGVDLNYEESGNGLYAHLHEEFLSDVQQKFSDGDHVEIEGGLHSGPINYVPGAAGYKVGDVIDKASFNFAQQADLTVEDLKAPPSAPMKRVGKTGRYYTYFDHVNEGKGVATHAVNPSRPELRGGVASCSTVDFINWRYEGTQVLSHNISTYGGEPLLLERPVVLYNNGSRKYVMWTQVDVRNRTGGAASTSTSDFPNGPFVANRTFLPDGNETHDQTLWQAPDGQAFLFRTYYTNVTYWLPEPVMQPMWQSVRDAAGANDFGLGYHRAFYHPGYDDYHDIYAQRWRREDATWNITYSNKQGCDWVELAIADDPDSKLYSRCAATPLPFLGTSSAVPSFTAKNVTVIDTLGSIPSMIVGRDEGELTVRALVTNPAAAGAAATTAVELTIVLVTEVVRTMIVDTCCTPGFNMRCCILLQSETHNLELLQHILSALRVVTGDGTPQGVPSSFKLDFTELAKNETSINGNTRVVDMEVTVHGQGGLRTGAVASRFLDPADPKNSAWKPSSVPAVKAQSWRHNYIDGNIADNPPHPALPDKLIGPEQLVLTRRSKYVAVSRLANDYLDTNGVLSTLEGEFEGEQDLIEIMRRFGGFSWSPHDGPIPSTHPQSIHGSDAPFSLQTSPDWDTRFHQYYTTENDRVSDPVNFLNELTIEQSSPSGLGARQQW